MERMLLQPARLSGRVTVPPSKSIAHRAVLCAALAGEGTSLLRNIALSDDIAATIRGATALGARFEQRKDGWQVSGADRISRENRLGCPKDCPTQEREPVLIDCNESGSTLRFLVPIALALGRPARFVGRGNLGRRPLDAYYNIMKEQGIAYRAKEQELDLTVCGRLKPGRFVLPGNVSSQYITGLLMALPLLGEASEIVAEGPLESQGYLDLTIETMRAFGVEATRSGQVFSVPAGAYRPCEYTVEGDYSQAAFFLVAGAVAGVCYPRKETSNPIPDGGLLHVAGLSRRSSQGDRAVCDILEQMGATVSFDGDGAAYCTASHLHGCEIDASQCPDIIPVLAAAACVCEGETRIVNAGRLRIKECDRLHAVAAELGKLGAHVEEGETTLTIRGHCPPDGGPALPGGGEVWSHADHRMAMTLAVLAAACEKPFVLREPDCVSKSYPNFFDHYRNLGGMIHEL